MRILIGGSGPDHYAVLGLTPGASSTDVTRAYRNLMRHLHPDTRAQRDRSRPTGEAMPDGTMPGAPVSSPDALRHVMDAYLVLGDPARRAVYDHDRVASPAPSGSEPAVRENHSRGGTPAPIKTGPVRWHQ
ncbi:MAG: J domain-containing protein [Ornithinibacter sp.]